ncbi:hypothetical protein ES708_07326 [subsurface metagenome]
MTLDPCFDKFPYLLEYPIYIDINNVAYSRFNKFEKPLLRDILALIDYLRNDIGFPKENIHCICDPSLKYYIDKPNEFKALIKEGLIIEAPKVADEMILSFALKYEFCWIISNDKFREYIDQLPSKKWLEDRRISFMIIEDGVCLSPNIDYKQIDLLPLNERKIELKDQRSTLEVLRNIEKTKGVFNLF